MQDNILIKCQTPLFNAITHLALNVEQRWLLLQQILYNSQIVVCASRHERSAAILSRYTEHNQRVC